MSHQVVPFKCRDCGSSVLQIAGLKGGVTVLFCGNGHPHFQRPGEVTIFSGLEYELRCELAKLQARLTQIHLLASPACDREDDVD